MTNREILEDFIVFYLCQFDELLSKVIFFYHSENAERLLGDTFQESRYQKFIRHYIEIEKFIDKEFEQTDINSLSDIIPKDKIKDLAHYLNENFRAGYPDEEEDGFVYGGNYELYITESELIDGFNNDYITLFRLNPNFYISHLYQLFQFNYSSSKQKIDINKEIIDSLYITKNTFSLIEKGEIGEHYNNKYKKKMLDSLIKRPLQFNGFIDKNGVFIDDIMSFRNWVIVSNGFKIKSEFDFLTDEKIGADYLIYKYYRYKFYNEDTVESSEDEINGLKIKFNKIKEKNRKLLIFLKDKGFDDNQCDSILNVLLDDEFYYLNLRSFPYIKKQVEFFRFCYFVYIFDFFEEIEEITFSRESDFDCLKINETYHVYNSDWKNQFKKYKKNHKNTNSRHFPFRKTVEKTLDTIENKLAIKREKLKSF